MQHLRMEIYRRELQERQEMFRKELANKSCQSNGRFSKTASANGCVSCGRPELRSEPMEEGELDVTLVGLFRKASHVWKPRSQIIIFSNSESGRDGEAEKKKPGESGSKTGLTISASCPISPYCLMTNTFN